VLVVDDNDAFVEALGIVVRTLGHEVQIARDGEGAIAMAEEFRPDLVLMDLGMPGMSGYEAAQRIRATPWGAGVRLVALTGWGQEEDKHRTREAGFDHHLVKPAKAAEIERLLAT
jgi:CheY-like chemotaxis protein